MKVYQVPNGQWAWVIYVAGGADILCGNGYQDEEAARQAMRSALLGASPITIGVGTEGFTVDEEAEAMFVRFVEGEMSRDELYAAILKLAEEGGEA